MRKIMFITILVAILFLAACNGNEEAAEKPVDTTDIEQLVHEYSTGDFEDVSASITSDELIVTHENGEEEVYELPEDKFFVSIAPYLEVTHPCVNHSLTGCQGELVNESFEVEIVDSEGNTVINETMETMDNGFIDLWLPRHDDYRVTISQEGKTVAATVSTQDGEQTCITTMQLQDVEGI